MSSGAVLGVVRSQWNAAAIVDEMLTTHFEPRDLSVLFPDPDVLQHPSDIGPGDPVGMLAGVGVMAIPGVGTLLACGPLLPGLARAQPAGTGGGVPQTLLELGVGFADAARYLNKLRSGHTLIAVRGHDLLDMTLAEDILIRFGAEDVWVSSKVLARSGSEAVAAEPIAAETALSSFSF
ncbi:MAG: hypothetical protein K1X64_20610 [Myxococcaceae bacterium]|nr:hypothetical protein [Myxococcaceae bacterium]